MKCSAAALPSARTPCCICAAKRCFPPAVLCCGHMVCLACWEDSQRAEWTSGKCPLCRRRLTTWIRTQAKREKAEPRPADAPPWPVDLRLWEEMRQRDDDDCEDDDDDDEGAVVRRTYVPGEVRQEYERELEKARKERRLEEERHRKETERLIRELEKKEEEERDRRLAEDEEVARRLAREWTEESEETAPNGHRSENESRESHRAPSPTGSRCGRFLKNFLPVKLWNNPFRSAVPDAEKKIETKKVANGGSERVTVSKECDSLERNLVGGPFGFRPLQPQPKTSCGEKLLKCRAKRAFVEDFRPVAKTKNVDVSSALRRLEMLKGRRSRGALDVSAFVCLLRIPKMCEVNEFDSDRKSFASPKKRNGVVAEKSAKMKSRSCLKDYSSSSRKIEDRRRRLSFDENSVREREDGDPVAKSNGVKRANGTPKKVDKNASETGKVDNGFPTERKRTAPTTGGRRRNDSDTFLNDENFSIEKIDASILEEQKRIEEKIHQEKRDFALAKKLQRQFGGENLMATTGFTTRTAAKRQATLIELIPNSKRFRK